MKRQRCTPYGFSLIELLVVLCIVSILAAILLPTLEQGLESSRDIACKNNLRQFGIAESVYSGDYRGPASVAPLTAYYADKAKLYHLLADGGYAENPNPQVGANCYTTAAKGMWQCPSVRTFSGPTPDVSAMLADAHAAPLFEAEYPARIPYGTARYTAAFLSHYMPFINTRSDIEPQCWTTWNYGTLFGAYSLSRYYKLHEMRAYSRVMLWTDGTSWRDPDIAFCSESPNNFIYNRHSSHFNATMWRRCNILISSLVTLPTIGSGTTAIQYSKRRMRWCSRIEH